MYISWNWKIFPAKLDILPNVPSSLERQRQLVRNDQNDRNRSRTLCIHFTPYSTQKQLNFSREFQVAIGYMKDMRLHVPTSYMAEIMRKISIVDIEEIHWIQGSNEAKTYLMTEKWLNGC